MWAPIGKPAGPARVFRGQILPGGHMAFDPVDLHVGLAIRARRKILGVSQMALAENIGVTFQQIQKYERARNRVSCSTLWRIAHALRARVDDFFPYPVDGQDARG
jgi:DNA-binding XRE family transcriptional regulator